jgi:serine protease Do
MIRTTLSNTRSATFCIQLPNNNAHGMPTPTGTGFFVSADGWFITAAHVVTVDNTTTGAGRTDLAQSFLSKEFLPGEIPAMCQGISIDTILANYDFALLRVDFAQNARAHFLQGRQGFPFLNVSNRVLDWGEPVYSFGYPLSQFQITQQDPGITVGTTSLSPRVTSAIVSSTMDFSRHVAFDNDPKTYVLDKALNYGNSGGPIISTQTGNVHALCSRFQPVRVPQPHLRGPGGGDVSIQIPSLYGVVSSLHNPEILQLLRARGVQISDT